MSRIGKLPIVLPKGVTVKTDDNVVSVEGPKGRLVQDYRSEVKITVDGDNVVVTRKMIPKQPEAFTDCIDNWLAIWSSESLVGFQN